MQRSLVPAVTVKLFVSTLTPFLASVQCTRDKVVCAWKFNLYFNTIQRHDLCSTFLFPVLTHRHELKKVWLLIFLDILQQFLFSTEPGLAENSIRNGKQMNQQDWECSLHCWVSGLQRLLTYTCNLAFGFSSLISCCWWLKSSQGFLKW